MCLHGVSEAHQDLLCRLGTIAKSDAVVFITGPTGVGKEFYARFVHESSHRSKRGFVAVNCGAPAEDLLENEFFGHEWVAYTGASNSTTGLVGEAEGGTLLLVEVDTFRPRNQIKLLCFLENKEYRPLGSKRIRQADIWIIAASNADLEQVVHEGRFREDLFFRLRVARVFVPPLHERREDIRVPMRVYVICYAEKYRLPAIEFVRSALEKLAGYDWPGNVRELLILPFRLAKERVVRTFERYYLDVVLSEKSGNIKRVAYLSGKHRRAFIELMRMKGIVPEPYRLATKSGYT